MAKPWHIPKRPFWQLPNLPNSPPPSTVTSQSLAKPCPEGRLGGEQYQISKKGQGPNRGTALAPDLLIHSPIHPPPPPPQIRRGSTTAAAVLVAYLPMEQCLGGASTLFAGAAAPRLSPLRTRPSSSRHCFLPEQTPPPQGSERAKGG